MLMVTMFVQSTSLDGNRGKEPASRDPLMSYKFDDENADVCMTVFTGRRSLKC